MKAVIQWVQIAFLLLSAGLWLFSAVQIVRPNLNEVDKQGMQPAVFTDTETGQDIMKTAKRQTLFNAWAAASAAVAALLQIALVC